MPKRRFSDDHAPAQPAKRSKSSNGDRLSALSDELIVRVLSFLPVDTLNLCQRLSRKYHRIAADSQLWKAHYYERFVRPRASRIRGLRETEDTDARLHFSSKLSKWLDEENLVKRGMETNWKRQYRLRHNWSKGSCRVSEIEVSDQPPVPPLLLRLHDKIIYTADNTTGLRAWSAKAGGSLLATFNFPNPTRRIPKSLAVDASASEGNGHRLVVGFDDGSFSVYSFSLCDNVFTVAFAHPPSSNGSLIAVACCYPYIITMTDTQLLSLYSFPIDAGGSFGQLPAPHLVHSLRSYSVSAPLSLSVRPQSTHITASIAYTIKTYLSGYNVGLQEIRLSHTGELLSTRVTTSPTSEAESSGWGSASSIASLMAFPIATPTFSKPTSLSYTHPYLLLSHPDNTLTLYMITSTETEVHISAGKRLWGHTSGVSGAHVGGRGKAVSVTRRGDELRIWELEGGRKRNWSRSVRVQTPLITNTNDPFASGGNEEQDLSRLSDATMQRGSGLGLAVAEGVREDDVSSLRGWVGFDEENVVVLRQGNSSGGNTALVVYDFT